MRVKGMLSVFLFCAVCRADCRSIGCGDGPLERQKLDSHDYRKTSILLLICRENPSRHYTNDEV